MTKRNYFHMFQKNQGLLIQLDYWQCYITSLQTKIPIYISADLFDSGFISKLVSAKSILYNKPNFNMINGVSNE